MIDIPKIVKDPGSGLDTKTLPSNYLPSILSYILSITFFEVDFIYFINLDFYSKELMIFYVLERRLGNIMRVIVVFFKFFLQLFNIGKFYL